MGLRACCPNSLNQRLGTKNSVMTTMIWEIRSNFAMANSKTEKTIALRLDPGAEGVFEGEPDDFISEFGEDLGPEPGLEPEPEEE